MNPILSFLLKSLLRFLGNEALTVLNDHRWQRLAVKAVEKTARLDLDNDGKHRHASDELRKELKSLGYSIKDRYISLLIGAAVCNLKNGK